MKISIDGELYTDITESDITILGDAVAEIQVANIVAETTNAAGDYAVQLKPVIA